MEQPIIKHWKFQGPAGEMLVQTVFDPSPENKEPLLTIEAQAVGLSLGLTMPITTAHELAKSILEHTYEKPLILMPPNTRRPS